MSHEVRLHDWVRPAQRRAASDLVLVWSPLVLVLGALAWAVGGGLVAAGVLVAGAIALGWTAARRMGQLDHY